MTLFQPKKKATLNHFLVMSMEDQLKTGRVN